MLTTQKQTPRIVIARTVITAPNTAVSCQQKTAQTYFNIQLAWSIKR